MAPNAVLMSFEKTYDKNRAGAQTRHIGIYSRVARVTETWANGSMQFTPFQLVGSPMLEYTPLSTSSAHFYKVYSCRTQNGFIIQTFIQRSPSQDYLKLKFLNPADPNFVDYKTGKVVSNIANYELTPDAKLETTRVHYPRVYPLSGPNFDDKFILCWLNPSKFWWKRNNLWCQVYNTDQTVFKDAWLVSKYVDDWEPVWTNLDFTYNGTAVKANTLLYKKGGRVHAIEFSLGADLFIVSRFFLHCNQYKNWILTKKRWFKYGMKHENFWVHRDPARNSPRVGVMVYSYGTKLMIHTLENIGGVNTWSDTPYIWKHSSNAKWYIRSVRGTSLMSDGSFAIQISEGRKYRDLKTRMQIFKYTGNNWIAGENILPLDTSLKPVLPNFKRYSGLTTGTAGVIAAVRQNLKSIWSQGFVKIEFFNQSTDTVKIEWIDYDGNNKEYSRMPPNHSYFQHTYRGHPWLISSVISGTRAAYNPPYNMVDRKQVSFVR